ncbi:IclR family transcriptional regulator C-terminal domain-containing protein [Kitasatospora sp. NPDC056800]|uniref:IclR family transcriptional regulator domain-containing protein n=1 Tax=Kitasatospora sp. NPDC056800 TaxID=3345948 RepID=UPI0036912285
MTSTTTPAPDAVPEQHQDGAPSKPPSSLAARAFAVQRAFTQLSGEVHSLRSIAATAGLDDATTHRILKTGVAGGVFEQIGRGRYRLGTGTARAGVQAMAHSPSAASTHTILERLHAATDGLALLYVLSPFGGAKRLCTDYVIGDIDPAEVGMSAEDVVSVSRSLRTGASGRVILAYLPQTIQDLVLAEEVPPTAGPGVIRDNDALNASLDEIRHLGFGVGRQECMPGWDSVSAPVLWHDSIMGSVLLLRRSADMPTDLRPLIYHTRKAAESISELTTSPIAAAM